MTLSNITAFFQSIAVPLTTFVVGFGLAVIVGGIMAYRLVSRRYGARESDRAHIESSAEISFIGQQDGFWIVELKAILKNNGTAQHKVHKFWFELNAISADDPIDVSKKWGGQVNFGNEVAKGSFIPRGYSYCVIGPSVTASYSYVARVPQWASFLILHCWFDYDPGFSHWLEKTVQVPASTAPREKRHQDAPFAAFSIQPGRSAGATSPTDEARPAHRWDEPQDLPNG